MQQIENCQREGYNVEDKVILLVEARILPEYRSDVLEAARTCLIPTLQEEGVEAFYQTVLAEDPNSIVFFEVFHSEAAHALHLNQGYTREFFSAIEGKLTEKPVMRRLNRISQG
jgi:quinol monooxygenase YgiN